MQHKFHSAVHIMPGICTSDAGTASKRLNRSLLFDKGAIFRGKTAIYGFTLCCKAVWVSPEITYASLWNLILTPSLCSYRFFLLFATAPYVDRRNRCRLSWIVASLSHRASTLVYNNTSVTPSVARFVRSS